jgi:hypothetical protein
MVMEEADGLRSQISIFLTDQESSKFRCEIIRRLAAYFPALGFPEMLMWICWRKRGKMLMLLYGGLRLFRKELL